MTVTQVYELTNTIAKELLGESAIVNEDLSNIVEIGNQFESTVGLDNYVRSLNDHIGRMVFVNRVYSGRVPSVLMDGWEYGSILEKVSPTLPEAQENESWELVDGASYDPNIFYKPSVSVKFWNKRVTFEIPISITERQVKSAFSDVVQLNAFISMLYTAVANAMTIRLDSLVMRTINNFIGETLYAEYPSGSYSSKSGIRAVNLLYLYNNRTGSASSSPLTVSEAMTTPEFIRFASNVMKNYVDYISVMSTVFNIGGQERFTPSDRLHWVGLSAFINAADTYLQSDTFHDEYTRLPKAETVPYWQGSGVDFTFTNVSKIDVTTASNHSVSAGGILSVMFDRDALGVTNMDRRVTSNYNPKAEFWNQYHKMDAGYFNDLNENFVVFFIA